MQRGLRMITLQGAIKKTPILLSQYWKNEWLHGTIIISYFGDSNNIFADCKSMKNKNSSDSLCKELPYFCFSYFEKLSNIISFTCTFEWNGCAICVSIDKYM